MNQFKLARRLRLHLKRDFNEVFQKGRKMNGGWCKVYYKENSLPHMRFAVIVPKRTGNAVRRNRMKRLIREYFRLHQHELKAFDIIIKVEQDFSHQKYADVERELSELLKGMRNA